MATETAKHTGAATSRAGVLSRHPYLVRSIWRRAFLAVNPMMFQMVYVNEFPKSGGTWLCRMVRDYLGWRFDDNTYPRPGKSVVKHHRIGLVQPRMVILIRDPRDTLVSYFHHCRAVFDDDKFNHGAVQISNRFIFEGIADPAERIREFVKTVEINPVSPAFTWRGFYDAARANDAEFFRYEDLRTETALVLTEVLAALKIKPDAERIAEIVDQHNIDRIIAECQKTRGEHVGHHFIRRGQVGGYVDELEAESIALIETNNQVLMRRYGYV